MMQSYHTFLCVHSCTAFLRRTDENTNIAAVHLIEKLLLLFSGIIIVYKSNFFFGNTLCDELIPNIVIDIECLGRHILNR